MKLGRYFARIGFSGACEPTLDTLCAIARLHPQAIAFENLVVVAGEVPDLSADAVFDKLVDRGRGGYCYEQNTLLQAVLTELGFAVSALSARVRYRLAPDYVGPRSHMILAVVLAGGTWIVDAGFGGLTLTAPVRLAFDRPEQTPHEILRLVQSGVDYRLQAQLGAEWVDVYQFDLSPQLAPDLAVQNWHTATRPNALFRDNLVATRPVAGGRYALFNQTLTWRPNGGEAERRQVSGASALAAVLGDIFGLQIPRGEIETASETAARGPQDSRSFG